MITLDKLAPGESGRVVKIHGRGAIRRRLVDMGLTTGAVIDVVKLSPLGDPVEYRLRGYHLSLRKSEARTIEVELIDRQLPPSRVRRHGRSIQPLSRSYSGQQVQIVQTRGGRRFSHRIRQLGLTPGAEITIVQNEFPGPIIISTTDGNRQVIGKGMARHVLVKPV